MHVAYKGPIQHCHSLCDHPLFHPKQSDWFCGLPLHLHINCPTLSACLILWNSATEFFLQNAAKRGSVICILILRFSHFQMSSFKYHPLISLIINNLCYILLGKLQTPFLAPVLKMASNSSLSVSQTRFHSSCNKPLQL